VEGVFVLDSTDPLCGGGPGPSAVTGDTIVTDDTIGVGPGPSAVTDDTIVTDDALSSHDRNLMETMGTESEAIHPDVEDQSENDESMDGDDDGNDTVQHDLQRYHGSSSFATRGGPRANYYGRGPRAQQTGKKGVCSFALRCLKKDTHSHVFVFKCFNLQEKEVGRRHSKQVREASAHSHCAVSSSLHILTFLFCNFQFTGKGGGTSTLQTGKRSECSLTLRCLIKTAHSHVLVL
jgi:hypothetical protein